MTYLRPGRALAGSHPARFLKQVVLAAYASASGSTSGDATADAARLRDAIDRMDPDRLAEVHTLVSHITGENERLNLTRWSQALARTADRVGLVLCGDLPIATRFTRDSGSREHVSELIAFAIGPEYLRLRAMMGLSIDV
jgi:hypothetical protein